MRTESDLHAAFALLEREGDDYLAASHAPRPADAHEPAHELMPAPARTIRRRRIILPIAAVAASMTTALAVLVVGGGGSTRPGAGGSGDPTPVCVTSLPAAWQAALSARTVTVDGTAATAEAVGVDGTVVVSWQGTDGGLRLGTVTAGTDVTPVYRLPSTAGGVWAIAADTHYAAMTIGRAPARVDDIVLVDLTSGTATRLLADAPPGATPSDAKMLRVQDGTVYWVGASGTLDSYDIGTHEYGQIPVDRGAVYFSPLGINWPGGSIPRSGLPPVHPALDDHLLTVAGDDAALAWSVYDDAGTLHWADRSGATRDLEQHEMAFLSVEAVAGPYVFLDSGEGSDTDGVNGDIEVLDTRTGAMADTGLNRWAADHSAGGLVTLSTGTGDTIRMLDTSGLPGLSC